MNTLLYTVSYPEELFSVLVSSRFFSKLDFRHFYEQY
uniref:Uncharacterized protein n=1 Tax=Lepeophtheirus salmonis TaxID=72036 RepID=A0A0K2URE4_LEPSM